MSFKDKSKARECAFKFLYQCEAEKIFFFSDSHFESFCEHFKVSGESKNLARHFSRGVLDNLTRIDVHLSEGSTQWSVARMTATDRLVLRLATFELLESSTPHGVILNEAIKTAKKFGTEHSGPFVNGVLDSLAKKLRS